MTVKDELEVFNVFPIGHVRRDSEKVHLDILKSYAPALKQLAHFSHAQVLWWFSGFQDDESRQTIRIQPPYENAPVSGVFAVRSPRRPNPIGLTTVRLLHVNQKRGVVKIDSIDAYDGTPILDLKPYIPIEDRVKAVRLPEWMAGWPEWTPEAGHDLKKGAGITGHPGQEGETVEIFPVGYAREKDGRTSLDILEPFAPALEQLEHFSHVRVLWWFHRLDGDRFRRTTQNTPPYENTPVTGVFASRSPVRPNPIGLTTAQIVSVDHDRGVVEITGIDAFDETPIVDLKPYIPSCDRVKDFVVPAWIAHWPEWRQDPEAVEVVDLDNLHPSGSDRLAALQAEQGESQAMTQPEGMPDSSPAGAPGVPDLDMLVPDSAMLVPDHSPALRGTPRDSNTSLSADGDDIVIRGARQHNLKRIDVTIPRDKFTVITGVSGSGKSSLAFDTLYAEGQRRYMESLSTLARRLVGQMEKPAVDHILGLRPTVAIEQRTVARNPRSTVGTTTEVTDYLRVLFARAGTRHCPQCGRAVKPQTPRQMVDQLTGLPPGTRFQLLAPGERAGDAAGNACAGPQSGTEDTLVTVVIPGDDLRLNPGAWAAFRESLFDRVETALGAGNGHLTVTLTDGEDIRLSTHIACPYCDLIFFELSPSLFSFNSPEGMCTDCNGLGVKLSVDPDLIVTKPHLSLLDEASPWWGNLRQHHQNPTGNWMRSELFALAERWEVDLELPWNELPVRFRHAALYGAGDEIFQFTYESAARGRRGEITRPVYGAVNHINRLLHRTSSEENRHILLQFVSEQPCPTCQGERLCPEARFVTVGHTRFPEVASMTIAQAHRWITELDQQLTSTQLQIASEIVQELRTRLQFMLNVGLHYLTLDRPAPTLSGGEGQRIRLASQLGCGLVGLVYVLDEPSIGLHPRDHRPLLDAMCQLRDAGNTIVVVEHDADTMRAADWLIDLGPGAGTLGGELVATGTPEAVMAQETSLTGRYLSGALQVTSPNGKERRDTHGWLTIVGARLHNLKGMNVRFPLGLLTCVTGVSGSGKSSLVAQTLSPALSRALHGAQDVPGPHDRIEGLDQINKVISITQAPIGRTPRSNPGTYVGERILIRVFDEIRKVFAATPEAKAHRYRAGRFSFNSKQGRCETCQGHGRRRVEMHFLPDVWVTCPECEGRRFNRQTLEITYKGKSIADVLDMDVQEAPEFFADRPKIVRILQTLRDVGLDYVKLGQSATTLSGGEAQRVKLARELSRVDTGRTLYILDEPTTGLHFADIQKLLDVLHRLTEAGNTVIVIEHNLDMLKAADWIIDLGPEGGDAGGYVVARGTPEDVAGVAESYTGQFLRQVL